MTADNIKPSKERIRALDLIRGALIIGMVLDHTAYSLEAYLKLPLGIFENPVRVALHWAGAYLFILLSGVSSYISRSNLRRGLKLAALAGGITLVTWLADHEFFIVFGILHLLAASMLIYAACRPALRRIPPKWQIVIYISMTFVTAWLTASVTTLSPYLWLFGFTSAEFSSGDYYPLLPWVFVFFTGVWAGPYVFLRRLPEWFYRLTCRPLELVGRQSLLIYILHQPIIIGLTLIIADRLSL